MHFFLKKQVFTVIEWGTFLPDIKKNPRGAGVLPRGMYDVKNNALVPAKVGLDAFFIQLRLQKEGIMPLSGFDAPVLSLHAVLHEAAVE